MLRAFMIAAALCAVLFASSVDRSRRDVDRVVVVTVDRLRPDHLPFLGYPRPTARFFVQLSDEGFLFERAYTASPDLRLALGELSIAKAGPRPALFDRLKRNGFETAIFTDATALAGVIDAPVSTAPDAMTAVKSAGDWLKEKTRGKKVAIWLHLERGAPGAAAQLDQLAPVGPELRRFLVREQGLPPGPDGLATPASVERVRAHDAHIAEVDRAVMRFYFDTLDRKKPTVWLFTALRGEVLDGSVDDGRRLDEGLLRVPFVTWFSDDRGPGKRYPGLVRHLDAAPTLLELALPRHRRWRSGMEGRSFAAALRKKGEWSGTATAFFERESGSRGIVAAHHKFVTAGGDAVLYDLRSAPVERRDLSGARPLMRERMARRLEAFTREHKAFTESAR